MSSFIFKLIFCEYVERTRRLCRSASTSAAVVTSSAAEDDTVYVVGANENVANTVVVETSHAQPVLPPHTCMLKL